MQGKNCAVTVNLAIIFFLSVFITKGSQKAEASEHEPMLDLAPGRIQISQTTPGPPPPGKPPPTLGGPGFSPGYSPCVGPCVEPYRPQVDRESLLRQLGNLRLRLVELSRRKEGVERRIQEIIRQLEEIEKRRKQKEEKSLNPCAVKP